MKKSSPPVKTAGVLRKPDAYSKRTRSVLVPQPQWFWDFIDNGTCNTYILMYGSAVMGRVHAYHDGSGSWQWFGGERASQQWSRDDEEFHLPGALNIISSIALNACARHGDVFKGKK